MPAAVMTRDAFDGADVAGVGSAVVGVALVEGSLLERAIVLEPVTSAGELEHAAARSPSSANLVILARMR